MCLRVFSFEQGRYDFLRGFLVLPKFIHKCTSIKNRDFLSNFFLKNHVHYQVQLLVQTNFIVNSGYFLLLCTRRKIMILAIFFYFYLTISHRPMVSVSIFQMGWLSEIINTRHTQTFWQNNVQHNRPEFGLLTFIFYS